MGYFVALFVNALAALCALPLFAWALVCGFWLGVVRLVWSLCLGGDTE